LNGISAIDGLVLTRLATMPDVFHDADLCAEAIVDRVGHDIRLAVPISIGKPILLIDALYRLAEADRRVHLAIFTGLTLARPQLRSSLQRRFAEPRPTSQSRESPTLANTLK
jgi:hypothetical protein